ncbi:MAG: hypothetical protein ACRECI_14435 [Methyloceanibacter sp.]
MNACSGISAIQILLVAVTFLLAVVSLDVFWVRVPRELHDGDIAGALRKQNWLNAFVAIGAAGAAVLLLVWVSSCSGGVL